MLLANQLIKNIEDFCFQKKYLLGAFLFAFLINMKHIYIYLAPAYFVYLLRSYCFDEKAEKQKKISAIFHSFSFSKFVQLGSTVIIVFLISFGPFYAHLPQVRVFFYTNKNDTNVINK